MRCTDDRVADPRELGKWMRKVGELNGIDSLVPTGPFAKMLSKTSMTLPNGTTISRGYNSAGQLTAITSDWVDAQHPATLASAKATG